MYVTPRLASFFFLNDPPPTEISTLPLHDALPIPRGPGRSRRELPHPEAPRGRWAARRAHARRRALPYDGDDQRDPPVDSRRRAAVRHCRNYKIGRAHSELQSQSNLVCRLLLEKKK